MNGYMNFARNNNNMCSVASYAMYPVLAKLQPATTAAPNTTATAAPTKPATTIAPTTTASPGCIGVAFSGCLIYSTTCTYSCPAGQLYSNLNQKCVTAVPCLEIDYIHFYALILDL